ncbi:hypothetical protein A8709_22970 [Paenibacillus pectinilyticus]|uniref:Murein biosynthesis integral membrane protein MurJ n=1 Tax=Paenibacillus pectinilyticus TaxID=512399 RepID=A0A1C0ZRK9_9BACL|nr:lipid II flippase MurJ [Paenibacillus pectinilyticus]OCT10702.1 hypothetical protein A8709_22970 [Paenibacillus pectinilyticus]
MKNLRVNASILVAFGVISAILGFFREIQIARYFGLSIGADIYYLGTYIPELIVTIVGSAASNIYMKQYHNHEKQESYAGAVLLLLSIIVFILFILLYFLFPYIALVLAPGFEGHDISSLIGVGRLMLIAMLASVFLGVIVATLNINGRFILAGLNGVIFNFILILIAYILVPKIGIYGLALSYLIAHVGRLIFLLPTTMKYFQIAEIKHSFFLLKEIPRVVLVNISGSIQVYFERSLSSVIGKGTIAALNYAGKITTLPNILFINSILTVIFPKLVTESDRNSESFTKTVSFCLKIVFIGLLCAELFIILFNEEIVKLLLEHGKFANQDSRIVSTLFYYFAPIVLISGVIQVLLKVAYALGKTTLTVKVMYISLPVYIVVLYLVKDYSSIYAFPISLFVYNITILLLLIKSLAKETNLRIITNFNTWKSTIIIVLTTIIVKIFLPFSPNNFFCLFIFCIIYLISFIALLYFSEKEFRKYIKLLLFEIFKNKKRI